MDCLEHRSYGTLGRRVTKQTLVVVTTHNSLSPVVVVSHQSVHHARVRRGVWSSQLRRDGRRWRARAATSANVVLIYL